MGCGKQIATYEMTMMQYEMTLTKIVASNHMWGVCSLPSPNEVTIEREVHKLEAECNHHWNHLLPHPTTLISSPVSLFNTSFPRGRFKFCRLAFEHIHDFFLISFDPFKLTHHSFPSSTYIHIFAFNPIMKMGSTIWSESPMFDRDYMT